MLKKITYLICLSVSIALPGTVYPISFFGKNIPHIDVQHIMEPLSMNPITIDQKNLTRFIDRASISITGTICTAAGAYLFSTGIKHALCNNTSYSSKASSCNWKDRIIETLSHKYSQGMLTSLLGATVFLGGLYMVGHNDTVLNHIAS